jgi:rhomboid family GlyGly-CTERM serine protease
MLTSQSRFMKSFRLTPSLNLALALTLLMLAFSATESFSFPVLSLAQAKVHEMQWWRIITGNFVHFGWAHTLMNLAAFLLCSFALLGGFSLRAFISLLLFCCVIVGSGIYFWNPEYETYAGLSGVLHGLIVAGLLVNHRHKFWINCILIALVFAKVIHENLPGYTNTELQDLLPVDVAYSAHLYGAIAGLCFGLIHLLAIKLTSKKTTH